eukprot:241201_1
MFEQCHWYDIPCPYPQCYDSNVRFDCHDKFKLHHEQCHCPRGENGDINRAKDSLRWKCPVEMTNIVEGKEITTKCNKISNSWYNYAGHITSHKEIGHGWGCALKPAGKRKKTNMKRLVHDHKTGKMVKMTVCGKRTSTKHHLLAHMANVHKTFNVIDTHGRQYNKKKERKRSHRHRTRSMIGKKRKFRDIEEDKDVVLMKVNKKRTHDVATSLLQMPMPSFHALQSMPNMHGMPHFPNLFTPKPHELPLIINRLLPHPYCTQQQHAMSPFKKMRLNASEPTFWIGTQTSQDDLTQKQFEFLKLLCKAADVHKGCTKCAFYDETEDEIETSLPSLSTYGSNSSNGSISDDTATTTTTNSHPLSVPKLPHLPLSLNGASSFPNFETPQMITKNVPFTFDLNQLQCSANNGSATAPTPFLKQNVITTAIPSLPAFTTQNNFN